MDIVFSALLVVISVALSYFTYQSVVAEELKVLESQLNKNSITGVVQNPYNYTVGGIMLRAEFYDKEGVLVGLRDFYEVSKEELKPLEKSSFKIYEHAGDTSEFPKTDFIVKAEGDDYTNMEEVSHEEFIEGINDITRALKNIPTEIVTTITTEHKNGTDEIGNTTITYENGTKEIVNKSGTYRIPGDDKPS
jgi:hypothetical protein